MKKFATKIANLKADANRWGWSRSRLSRIARVTGRFLGLHIHIVRANAMVDNPVYPSTLAGITYRMIHKNELLEASSDPQLQLSQNFLQAATKRGDIAFGAFDGSVLVSYVWRSFGAAPHKNNLWVKVDKPYCYSYKSYTRPDYRGRRISPGVHLCSDVGMLKHGFKYRAGFVEISNWASLAMSSHMGSHYVGYAGFAKWFGRYFPFRTGAVKKIGFEFLRSVSSYTE